METYRLCSLSRPSLSLATWVCSDVTLDWRSRLLLFSWLSWPERSLLRLRSTSRLVRKSSCKTFSCWILNSSSCTKMREYKFSLQVIFMLKPLWAKYKFETINSPPFPTQMLQTSHFCTCVEIRLRIKNKVELFLRKKIRKIIYQLNDDDIIP